tara:strand:+ start:1324 stop:1587 length:264 start_codon:yes stop_codon:yes gene_type:complete
VCADDIGQHDNLRTFYTYRINGGYCNRTNKKAVEKTSLPPANLSAVIWTLLPSTFLVFIIFIIIVFHFVIIFTFRVAFHFVFIIKLP